MKPKYTHDCPHCRYLDTVAGVDHYACHATDGTKRVSLIQRDGNDGAAYDSLPLHEGLRGVMASMILIESDWHQWRITLRLARAYHSGYLAGLGRGLADGLSYAGVEVVAL